jgi:formate C-acetyltransferase
MDFDIFERSFPPTERIVKMRNLIRDRVIVVDADRAVAITNSYRRNEHLVPIVKRAIATADILSAVAVPVEDFEIIVGSLGKTFCGSCTFPEYAGDNWIPAAIESGKWTMENDGLYHTPVEDVGPLAISPENYEALSGIDGYWKEHNSGVMADAWQPDGYEDFVKLGASSYSKNRSIIFNACGHLVPGYEKILTKGYAAIADEVKGWMSAHEGFLMGEDLERFLFYKSVAIVCDATSGLIRRYGEACLKKAECCADAARKAELSGMGASLMWIAENPARTYLEACQATVMYALALELDSGQPAMSLGRFDQYTWPYLKSDLESGMLSPEQAQEITDAFFLKIGCLYRAWSRDVTRRTGSGNTYKHTTIGGVDPDTGADASNPVTYMTLHSMARLELHDPNISLRFHAGTPDSLWRAAIETTKRIGGIPLFQNDEVVIPALMEECGFSLRDARDCAFIGCQEIVGSGNDYPAPNGVHPPHGSIHYSAALTMAINNGTNPANGESCKIKTGYLYEMNDIEEVKEAFARIVRYLLHWQVTMNNYSEYISSFYMPHALLSVSIEGCIESGKDCVRGGAKYNSYGGTAAGLATVADSLSSVRYACFDRKLCSTRELYDAVMANWEGYEPLRQKILAEAPHYGNGDAEADEMMEWAVNLYYAVCKECGSARTKIYKSGMFGATDHINQGRTSWATPDGRKYGEPLADAASPAQGRDRVGPTGVFRSAVCFDHKHLINNLALNIRLHPSVVSNDTGLDRLRDATKTYFSCGGMETQFNVVSTDTLRAAQSDPDKYKDLVVRIAGFSAYFIELDRDSQDNLIARNETVL